jgi:hypothetical protein
MTRKRSAYRPTLKHVPVMKELHDQIGMGLHTAYAVLERAPDRSALDQLSEGLGMVGLAIDGDERFADSQRQVDSALRALEQIAAKGDTLTVTAFELAPIRNAVSEVDLLLPRLDGVKLYLGLQKLRALAAAQ